jgi:hypothetical protein
MVPADELRAILRPVLRAEDERTLACRSGVHLKRIEEILSGQRRYVAFATADRIITRGLGDPSIWWRRPRLKRVITSPIDERYRDPETNAQAIERGAYRTRPAGNRHRSHAA